MMGRVCTPDSPPVPYQVQRGDCLWRIAARELGNPNRWPEIADLNGLSHPYRIFVGQRLLVPGRIPSASAGSHAPLACFPDDTRSTTPHQDATRPAHEVLHCPLAVELDDEKTLLEVTGPGVRMKFGMKGTLVFQRKDPAPISLTRDGPTVDYEHTQKLWGSERFLELLTGFDFELESDGTISTNAKVILQTPWHTGTFELSPDLRTLKYELEPQPLSFEIEDVKVEGTVSYWLEISRDDFRGLRPDTVLVPIPTVSQRDLERWFELAPTAGVTIATGALLWITFQELLAIAARGALASMPIIFIVPPDYERRLGDPRFDSI